MFKFSEYVIRIVHFIVLKSYKDENNGKLKKQQNILSTCQNGLRWEFSRINIVKYTSKFQNNCLEEISPYLGDITDS